MEKVRLTRSVCVLGLVQYGLVLHSLLFWGFNIMKNLPFFLRAKVILVVCSHATAYPLFVMAAENVCVQTRGDWAGLARRR